ncbi:hypothetical protein OU995_16390 [Roseateles sp. SL47]|uniref:sialate O-acetylesterase n=1 Tax=Roseateles sp. SL47 TaxID=2995138 RepID=UPI002270B90D|nr:sialate O-acetylesterase [Roseateles sp. SL47]WAC71173.1 hypothetical protein OU995_16390 [Roseateles sp. SL47]
MGAAPWWAAATAALLTLSGGAAALKFWADDRRTDQSLAARVATIQDIPADSRSCDTWLAGRMPLVLVAMGQSNAGNHGDLPAQPAGTQAKPIPVLHQGRCVLAQDPLPGATGQGASVWSALHQRLGGQWNGRPIVWMVVAVDGTRLDDWTDDQSPLRRWWERQIDATVATGWPIAAVLWQQGEADARQGTSTEDYMHGLRQLRALTEAHGLPGPWWLARSTYCPPVATDPMRKAVRQAVEDLLEEPTSGFRAGPDTDALPRTMRNGCHFTAEGVEAAAALWQQALVGQRPGPSSAPSGISPRS